MNKNVCPKGMVYTCCENYDNCTFGYDKDAEIKRLNEKIEFLARTNMLYSEWERRETPVTNELIRKGIEEHKINAELRSEIERLKQREWVGLTDEEIGKLYRDGWSNNMEFARAIEAKLKEKNT